MHNRRDLAKRETREALADAAIAIARADGVAALTADAIADRAGVSRRTFFNYFPTTDAVLAVPSMDFVTRAIESFEARPLDEPVPTAAVEALLHGAAPDDLARLADVVCLCRDDAAALRVERDAWGSAEEGIASALARRLPAGTEPLRLRVQASMIAAAGRAAVQAWAEELDADGRGELPPEAVDRLRALLLEAIGYLADGLRPTLTPPDHR